MNSIRYEAQSLVSFADGLLTAGGLNTEKAGAVAAILVEGDLMGHNTHGLTLLVEADKQRDEGVVLYPSIKPSLAPWAHKLGVAMPAVISR